MVLSRAPLLAGLLLAGLLSGLEARAGEPADTASELERLRHPHPATPLAAPVAAAPAAAAPAATLLPDDFRDDGSPDDAMPPVPPLAATPAPVTVPLPAHAAEPLADGLEALRRPHRATPLPTPPTPLALPSVTPATPARREAFHSEDRIADSERSYAEDPGEADQSDGSDSDDPTADYAAMMADSKKPYVVDTFPPEDVALKPPTLPDLSGYTAAAARAKLGRARPGRINVGSMLDELTFKGFMGRDERLREWASRQFSLPKVIFISGGTVTPNDLARALPKNVFEQTADGEFIARLPIDIRPGATLHIGDDVKVFRLSQDRGAFIANEGRFFLTGSALEAWNEAKRKPAVFEDKHEFRPFLVSWGGSELYIVGSRVAHLGYAASKSYGVSVTQFGPALAATLKRPRPTGWILDSEFYDLWYGFYCYEADDVVIRNNVYHDNIKYGIDPHDRSRRLIIAGNTAYGTKEKHGIIVSREVNDSWIIDNKSYENGLSGIVVDRSSVNNLVAHNQVYRNHSDGITIYESPDTLLWQNVSTGNGRHGIRVRNSTDLRLYDNVAVGNNLSGIYGHIKDLRGTDRNLRLDPFHQRVSMVVVGGQLVSNGSGPVSIDQPLSLELYDVDLRAPRRELGIKFSGVLGAYQDQVLDLLVRQRKPVAIRPADAQRTARN